MRSRTRITIEQSQRLSLNTTLSAAIRLLGADAAGLSRYLEEMAAENPQLVVEPPPQTDWLPRWRTALSRAGAHGGDGDLPETEAAGPSLIAHVTSAMEQMKFSAREMRLAGLLVEALEPSGWLGRPPAAIAAEAGAALAEVEAVLARLQTIEPAGLFARNLAECLRLQAAEAGLLDRLMAGVLDRLPLVASGAIDRIARDLGATDEDIRVRVRRLRSLDPKPGSHFAPCASPVREPDLIATRTESGWDIALNRSSLPTLRLADAKGPGRAEARALIRLVEGRNATLIKVGREILLRQVLALEEGPGALQPMTMAEIATSLGLNQSTVSRAVAGTAVDTPKGTWWLRAMFSQAIRGQGPSAAALREGLARMVAAEDPARPLSDAALAAALAGAGAPVARRTIAKYRELLGIPSAHLRRRGDRKGRSRG